MGIIKIDKRLTKKNNENTKFNMLYRNNKDDNFYDFFINSVVDYNSNHKNDGKFMPQIGTLFVHDIKSEDERYSDEYFNINEVMQLFNKKLFRHVKKDIDNRIDILYIKNRGTKEGYYLILSNKVNKRILNEFKDYQFKLDNYVKGKNRKQINPYLFDNYSSPNKLYEVISKTITSYINISRRDRINDKEMKNMKFFLIPNKEELNNFLSVLMKKYNYQILNCNFFRDKKGIELYSLYFKDEVLDNLDSISYKDIINKNKEKITFVQEDEYKKIAVKESFK